jgi:diguanylate cyclase (GGDEF)-like protein
VDTSFLRSRVARRIFVLFILAAVVPIVVTALLVFTYVRRQLLDTAVDGLAEQSKAYGLERYDRLVQATGTLERLAASVSAPEGQRATLRSVASPQFRSLVAVDASGHTELLLGQSASLPVFTGAERERLLDRQAVLHTSARVPGAAAVFLAVAAVVDGSTRIWVGEVDGEYLWQDSEQPAEPWFAVFDERGALIYSSDDRRRGMSANDAARLRALHRDVDDVQIAGQPVVFSNWHIFMRPKFGIDGWTAALVADRAAVLAPLAAFRRIYPGVLGATLMVVVLVSLIQIRRSHRPLEQLVENTRRLAKGEFRGTVEIRDGTEFSELAAAMNDMSTRLGRQFAALRTLADVDRLMLASAAVEPVLDTVFAQTCQIIRCRAIAVTLADSEAPQIGRTFRMRPDLDTEMTVERVELTPTDLPPLTNQRGGIVLSADDDCAVVHACTRAMGVADGAFVLAYPIIVSDVVNGAVSVLFDGQPTPDADTRQLLHDLADRLAVTLANHARERALVRQAHYDGLTGLPNRELFRDRLNQELARARQEQQAVGLLFLDLDRFKHVNDANGHSSGDQLLRQAATRLRDCVHESATVARLGGDEFTVILPNITSTHDAAAAAEAAIARLNEPFIIDGTEHHVTGSIGIACFPADGRTSEELLKSADMAMYRAKANGRGTHAFFEDRMNSDATKRRHLESRLRRALAGNELLLHYQPLIRAATGEVESVEALVRWRHPELGLVPPSQFIPVAEETGLILDVGRWVLRDALTQMRRLRAAGVRVERMAINVSARQLRTPQFVEQVFSDLALARAESNWLELEVTESALIEHIDSVRAMLARLRAGGVRIAIDDFGTGYSSLRYLKDLPFDSVKIDRAFVEGIDGACEGTAIVDAVISMAHALGKQVVAEGVETPAQLDYLTKRGCDLLQGFLLFKPMLPAELQEALEAPMGHVVARSGLLA